jgi:hypothetical protein
LSHSASLNFAAVNLLCRRLRRNQMILANTLFQCVCYHPEEFQIITSGTDRKVSTVCPSYPWAPGLWIQCTVEDWKHLGKNNCIYAEQVQTSSLTLFSKHFGIAIIYGSIGIVSKQKVSYCIQENVQWLSDEGFQYPWFWCSGNRGFWSQSPWLTLRDDYNCIVI